MSQTSLESPLSLRIGNTNPIDDLDPQNASDSCGILVQLQLYQGPYTATERGIVPSLLAEPLRQVSQSPRRYEAPVRPDVRFSDGERLTAGHVAASLVRSRRLGSHIQVEVVGGRLAVTVADASLDPTYMLSTVYCHVARRVDARWLGTGPYQLARDSTPEQLRLTVNPYYRGPAPRVPEILVTAYPGQHGDETRGLAQAVRAGRVDFTNMLPMDALPDLPHIRRRYEPEASTAVLWINTRRVPDRNRRRALAMAIDRDEVGRSCHRLPTRYVAAGLLPPSLVQQPPAGGALPHDLERARSLLAEAGRPPGPLDMLVIWGPRLYMPQPRRTAECIRQMLDKIGVTVNIRETTSAGEYLDAIRRGDYDLVLGGWSADDTDAAGFLSAFCHSDMIPDRQEAVTLGCNFSRWCDARMDRLLAQYRDGRLDETLEHITGLIASESVVVPLSHGAQVFTVGPRVRWFDSDPLGHVDLSAFALTTELAAS
ncbi:MAG: ABC transporter substrate-binding protein [Myxococcales bacterium FL481]|nr:MAG: ABC transporter substrate-binding protein [Myxococcales bacterium FL481]